MGKTKSKEIRDVGEYESARIHERQENINKLIERMTSKIEPPPVVRSRTEVKKLSFRRKKKKKEDVRENNNEIERLPVKGGEPNCCETSVRMVGTGMPDLNIGNGDSIDNIIDLIVDKSIRRDELLNQIVDEKTSERNGPIRRRSYHGKESKRASLPEEGNLIERLENLEKRATMFERKSSEVPESKERGSSRSSGRSEEFEKNMKIVLQENYLTDEPLKDLKTIERVLPWEKLLRVEQDDDCRTTKIPPTRRI
ncbi:UNVERIFIED_CONTAM: hypothetical protein PYX00_004156 [Menopon gallinae]|uniref:Uncharacterized protein n=1 Tax=Menopon gallinae TaxID=328185 RepID=A0AAW2I4I7_9NEOP